MGDHKSGPQEAVKGVVEGVKGKAKEVGGTVAGRDDLVKEGQAQQDKADAQRDAGKKEAEAEVGARGRKGRRRAPEEKPVAQACGAQMLLWKSRIVAFLAPAIRTARPLPATCRCSRMLPRKVPDADEVTRHRPAYCGEPSGRSDADVGVAITRVTGVMPSFDDIERVQRGLDVG